ncbi:MAG: LLM class flavin-dependent oxidoreductase [Capsulimonadaceae bacterium]|nr:LLM class flavin-dependent oxidoreductase [Capsulimonadaceae bacterium]
MPKPNRRAGRLRLSVLDQSPVPEGSTGTQALRNSIELAMCAERLGYHRFWLAEHHGMATLACTSPDLLIGQIAAATSRIRVGAGGVMLPHYSPFKIAENYSTLAGLFPGRIDLSIGRAKGTDATTALALQRNRYERNEDNFIDALTELLGYLRNSLPAAHPFAHLVETLPGYPEQAEVWLLGSSPQSAIWAGDLGLRYMFGDFINANCASVMDLYRERFTPSPDLSTPYAGVCAWVVCADTEDDARSLASSGKMLTLLLREGKIIKVPPVETAVRYLESKNYGPDGDLPDRNMLQGTPQRIRPQIEDLARSYGVEEVVLVNIMHDHQARIRSYELIAEEFGLAG